MLGEKIRAYRVEYKLTQQAFADLAGVAKATIVYIEAGKQKPNAFTENKIRTVLEEKR